MIAKPERIRCDANPVLLGRRQGRTGPEIGTELVVEGCAALGHGPSIWSETLSS